MTLKINFNLNLPDSCCTLVPKNGVWTVPKIAACQIAKNAALLIPDYNEKQRSPATNSGLAKVAVQFFV